MDPESPLPCEIGGERDTSGILPICGGFALVETIPCNFKSLDHYLCNLVVYLHDFLVKRNFLEHCKGILILLEFRMGVPFHTHTFCSLLAVEEFVDDNPDLMGARITITGVHVRDVFELVDLLSGKEHQFGWDVGNLDSIRGEGRKFALFVEDFEFLVDQAIGSIDDDGAITANLGESLKEEAAKFLELVKGNNSFRFFLGFAQFTVHVGDNAIEAAAIPEGEEESDVDGEGDTDGEVDADEGAPADGEEGDDEAVQDEAPRLVRLREKLVQVKAVLARLPALRLVFPQPEQNPVQYIKLADFAHSFPVEPEPVVPPALPADGIAAQHANGAEAAPEE